MESTVKPNYQIKWAELLHNAIPSGNMPFSICDSRISSIECNNHQVRFIFSNGYYVKQQQTISKSTTGEIEFSNIATDEIHCYRLHREYGNKGAIIHGEPLSIEELSKLINGNHLIELFTELYDVHCVHWRGVLLPYSESTLSDHIIIEINSPFTFKCFWE